MSRVFFGIFGFTYRMGASPDDQSTTGIMTFGAVSLYESRGKLNCMNRYVTVKCPSCRSISQIKADAVRSEIFYCPVCEDGEIEYHPVHSRVLHEDARLSFELPELVPVAVTTS